MESDHGAADDEMHHEVESESGPDQSTPTWSDGDLQPSVKDVTADQTKNDGAVRQRSFAKNQTDDDQDSIESRRESGTSDNADDDDVKRWPSVRTQALIHAAAKDIVAHVSTRPSHSIHGAEEEEEEQSSFADESYASSLRESIDGQSRLGTEYSHTSEADGARRSVNGDDAGDSCSSHHGHDDDVFSDNSPRSSMGSVTEAEQKGLLPRNTSSSRSRMSEVAQPDRGDDHLPLVRGTPRPPFRSPSSVKAIQMSSPPASVIGSSGSSRRTPRPTVSRLASPSVSAQYSPKKTPPRFKRNTPPLVLLHVTIMPSRWPWGHVLDNAHPDELSSKCRGLWESWRQLQDCIRDTTSDRGILLPHPQNDYEVLEERLLETLELPLRRRARILACGHYLGPSNAMSVTEEAEREEDDDHDDDDNRSHMKGLGSETHWCDTCHSDIRFESLGAGKVFKVNVFASNGLMRAGAWEACWKDMERVDVELEPIVDANLHGELVELAASQERALDMEDEEVAAAAAAAAVDEELQRREAAEVDAEQAFASEHIEEEASHLDGIHATSTPRSLHDDSRLRDEERLREIYGHSQPSRSEHIETPESRRRSAFSKEQRPPSPQKESFERHQEKLDAHRGASLAELILEAIKVLIQDQKNMVIGLLGLLVLMLAIRGGSSQKTVALESASIPEPAPPIFIHKQPESAAQESVKTPVEPAWGVMEAGQQVMMTSAVDSCMACSRALEAAEASLKSTVTSNIEVTQTVTHDAWHTVTKTVVETVTLDTAPPSSAFSETALEAPDFPGEERAVAAA